MFQWIQFIMFHYSVPPTLNEYLHYLYKGNMNGCIYPCSVPRCYPPEVYHQEGLQPRTSPGPGSRTSRTPSLGSRKSSLSNHSSRLSSCSSRSCSPRPRLRRESAQVFKIFAVIAVWLFFSGFWGRWPRSKHQYRDGWSESGMQQKAAVLDRLWQWTGPAPEVGTRHAPPSSSRPEPVKVLVK